MSRDPMRRPLQDLMDSVAEHRDLQMQKLRANPAWAEKLARIGTLQVPMPALRDFSDGKEPFDTSATRERLALEIDVSNGGPERFDAASSSSSRSFGRGERRDMWTDLTASLVGIDEPDDVFQAPRSVIGARNERAANEDLKQRLGLTSIEHGHKGLLRIQEPWDAHVASDNEGGWLVWDNVFSTEGVP